MCLYGKNLNFTRNLVSRCSWQACGGMSGCLFGGSCMTIQHLYTPILLYIPPTSAHPLYIHISPIHQYVPYLPWGLGGICTLVHLSDISVSVSTSICPSVHNSHTSCSPSLWVASLLDIMPMDVCYVSCCWPIPFFLVFSLCLKLLLPQLWLLLPRWLVSSST